MKDKLNVISNYFKIRNDKFYFGRYGNGNDFRHRLIREDKNGLIGLSIDRKLQYKVIGKNKRLYTAIKTLRNILTDEEITTLYNEILKKNTQKDEINNITENLKSVSTKCLREMLDEIDNFSEDYSFYNSTEDKICKELARRRVIEKTSRGVL